MSIVLHYNISECVKAHPRVHMSIRDFLRIAYSLLRGLNGAFLAK